jgi:hypothetical protein
MEKDKHKPMSEKVTEKFNKISLYVALSAIAISLLTFIGFYYDLTLKNRPYLYVEPEWPLTWTYVDPEAGTSEHRKILVSIKMHNKGAIPASIINNDWYIAADGRRITTPSEFYKRVNGRDLLYQTVFPDQTINLPKYKPDVGPITKIVDLNLVITYEGTARSILGLFGKYMTYWYSLKATYEFEYTSADSIRITQISYETSWDRNKNRTSPVADPQLTNDGKGA